MNVSKEVKIGLMVLVAIAAVVFGYGIMKGNHFFDSSKKVYAIYDDVEGLTKSSEVTINGLRVGSVSEIRFLNQTGEILVAMRIKSDFAFSKNSIAEIYSEGLIGGKILKIHPDYKGSPIQSGDTLQSHVAMGMMGKAQQRLEPMVNDFQAFLEKVDTLVNNINKVLDEPGRKNISESIAHLNGTLANLEQSSGRINKLLDDNGDHFDNIFTNLSDFSDSLAKIEIQPLVAKTDAILNEFNLITEKLNNGDGMAAKLLNDSEVYDNIDHATRQLEELLQDIKLNPKRYINVKFSIFGGKNKTQAYEKPEDRSE